MATDELIHSKPYSLSNVMQKEVEKELDDVLKSEVTEPPASSYSSPVVIIRKPDELNKVCKDFSTLDKVTVVDPKLRS